MTDSPQERIQTALDIAMNYGGTDGDHHKMWVIDQMVRCLTGCPTVKLTAFDVRGLRYEYDVLGQSDEYRTWVTERKAGKDGPETYAWETGVAP